MRSFGSRKVAFAVKSSGRVPRRHFTYNAPYFGSLGPFQPKQLTPGQGVGCAFAPPIGGSTIQRPTEQTLSHLTFRISGSD
jgi:hypothetical protein